MIYLVFVDCDICYYLIFLMGIFQRRGQYFEKIKTMYGTYLYIFIVRKPLCKGLLSVDSNFGDDEIVYTILSDF